MSAPHAITIGPSAAVIVDANGRVSELPKARSATYRARCTCGWRSVEYASEAQAKAMGARMCGGGWAGNEGRMGEMKAFTAPAEVIKAQLIASLKAHRKPGRITQGAYWQGGRGCAVGCSIHDFRKGYEADHSLYESLFGVPEGIARLEDAIFKGLPLAEARSWPLRFVRAIPEGADLTRVLPAVLYRILERRRDALTDLVVPEGPARDEVVAAVERVRAAMQRTLDVLATWRDMGEMDADAAESACVAADSARFAADSAWGAATSAKYAADSARQAALAARFATRSDAAFSAKSAAHSARYAAEAAGDAFREAGRAEYRWIAGVLIEELEQAPVWAQ